MYKSPLLYENELSKYSHYNLSYQPLFGNIERDFNYSQGQKYYNSFPGRSNQQIYQNPYIINDYNPQLNESIKYSLERKSVRFPDETEKQITISPRLKSDPTLKHDNYKSYPVENISDDLYIKNSDIHSLQRQPIPPENCNLQMELKQQGHNIQDYKDTQYFIRKGGKEYPVSFNEDPRNPNNLLCTYYEPININHANSLKRNNSVDIDRIKSQKMEKESQISQSRRCTKVKPIYFSEGESEIQYKPPSNKKVRIKYYEGDEFDRYQKDDIKNHQIRDIREIESKDLTSRSNSRENERVEYIERNDKQYYNRRKMKRAPLQNESENDTSEYEERPIKKKKKMPRMMEYDEKKSNYFRKQFEECRFQYIPSTPKIIKINPLNNNIHRVNANDLKNSETMSIPNQNSNSKKPPFVKGYQENYKSNLKGGSFFNFFSKKEANGPTYGSSIKPQINQANNRIIYSHPNDNKNGNVQVIKIIKN